MKIDYIIQKIGRDSIEKTKNTIKKKKIKSKKN